MDNDFVAEYDDLPAPVAEKEKDTPNDDKPVEIKIEDAVDVSENDIDAEIIDPIEEAARAQGWVPKEEWEGDPSLWRDSQVFLERGEYFKTMSTQRKQIEKLHATMEKMAEIQAKVREDERQKVLKELSEQKLHAMEDGEYSKVMEIDAEIDKVRSTPVEVPKVESEEFQVTDDAEIANQKVAAYVEKNKWYRTNSDMRFYADALATGYRNENPQATVDDVLEYTDAKIKERYPEVFSKGTPSASPVASSARTTQPSTKGAKKKKTLNDLPAEKREMYAQIGQSFVNSGAVDSIDEYIAELEKIGEL